MKYTTSDAVAALGFVDFWGPDNNLKYPDGVTPPSESAINAKLAELKAAEPIRLLREKRNRLLAATDWRDLPSYAGTKQAEWRLYRQALRDITVGLDTVEKVNAATFPTQPS